MECSQDGGGIESGVARKATYISAGEVPRMDGALRGYLFIPRVPASVAERQRPGLSGLRHGERTKAAIVERQKFSALLKMLRAGLT